MATDKPLLSIVCPAYQEEAVLPRFHARLCVTLEQLHQDFHIEIVYVDDGSRDHTLEVLQHLAEVDDRVRYLSLSRNFGHQAALTAGLEHAEGDVVITMDADLQHPPEVIHELIYCWRNGIEIVLTERHDAHDTGWFKRATSKGFYWLLTRLSAVPVQPSASDFRLMTRPAVDALLRLRETHRYLRGMVNWLGFKVATVPYLAAARAGGQSSYTLSRMLRLAFDGLLSFSSLPLRLPLYLGIPALGLGIGTGLVCILLGILGKPQPWLTEALLVSVLTMGGTILISLGIVGEYLGRVFEQVKQRPLYIVRTHSEEHEPIHRTWAETDLPLHH